MPGKSLTCPDALVKELGKTASCDVQFTDSKALRVVVTVTALDPNFGVRTDLTMTREQVEKSVAATESVPSASCESGLEGKVGATTRCRTQVNGESVTRIAEVTTADPLHLRMDLAVRKP